MAGRLALFTTGFVAGGLATYASLGANNNSKLPKGGNTNFNVGNNHSGNAAEAFKSDGVIGKQFNDAGAIGGLAQKVGGPFAKDGTIGKEFTDTGAVGGTVQNTAEKLQSKETDSQTHKKTDHSSGSKTSSSSKDKNDHSGNAAEAFKSDGVVGKQFNDAGAIGGLAQKVGGPFAKDGAIGKHFTDTGAVGGTVQNTAEKLQSKETDSQTHKKTDHSSSSSSSSKSEKKEKKGSDKNDHSGNAAEAFKSDGVVGKQFNDAGAIGGLAQKVGGPFAKDGAIGKHFTDTGAVGGTVQNTAEKLQSDETDSQTHKKTDHSSSSSSKSKKEDKKEKKGGDKNDHSGNAAEAFKSDGVVGKQFNDAGAIGGLAQKVGGPFAKDGAIGKHFTDTGAVGGTVQNTAEKLQSDETDSQTHKKTDHSSSSKSKKEDKKEDKKEKKGGDKNDHSGNAAEAFKSDGVIGKQFNDAGAIGGLAQKVGGPFAKDGAIGKHFTDTGAVGGTVQQTAEKLQSEETDSQTHKKR